jgi:hypothetical protein
MAELLATSRIQERLAELSRQVEGLTSEQIAITAGSPYDGRPLGDTHARTRTGASIVAIVRNGGDRQPGRTSGSPAVMSWWWSARGEFNIVFAGLAVAAHIHPDLGPLATAYVLILAVTGPLAARAAEPFARLQQQQGNGT